MKVIEYIYADHIDEQPEDEREEYRNNLVSDFYFLPCTEGVEFGENPDSGDSPRQPEQVVDNQPHTVFECWVNGDKASFQKFREPVDVFQWLNEVLPDAQVGAQIHVVVHSSLEYGNGHET